MGFWSLLPGDSSPTAMTYFMHDCTQNWPWYVLWSCRKVIGARLCPIVCPQKSCAAI